MGSLSESGIRSHKSQRRTLRERFDQKWMPEPNSGCWLWLAGCDTYGYGQMRDGDGRQRLASRISWELFFGPIGTLCVLHRCDTTACVNPDHLFLGTHRDNMHDMSIKRRHWAFTNPTLTCRGESHGQSKLTAGAVRLIRSSTLSADALARSLGVSPATISDARHRKTWRHIP